MLKRRNVENPSNPGSEMKKRRCKDGSQKNLDRQITSTQLSSIPARTQIFFVIIKIVIHMIEGLVKKTKNEKMDMNKD